MNAAESSPRDPVERLAESFLQRYRRGERPSLTDYCEANPELAEEIRDLFPAIVEMEGLKSPADESTDYAPLETRSIPSQLGDYQIIREIGRGGMGVVFEAIQQSLSRRVAVKVLPPCYAQNRSFLARFRREARAAASLHHTNIVPVFGVGENAGCHYFAMQFIRGQSLEAILDEVRKFRDKDGHWKGETSRADLVSATMLAQSLVAGAFRAPASAGAELRLDRAQPATEVYEPASSIVDRSITPAEPDDGPLDPMPRADSLAGQDDAHYHRSIAQVGLQVAEALAYAHGQGILHRDIKPSNLLMDLAGTVWVADFGLAKPADGDDLSKSRDLVGTLRYMAPERFDGWSDRRSDVYGVGVTLYELLTLQPAFDGTDQPRLMRQILGGSPAAPHTFDRRIPRDLETICAKAMAKEPAERYTSADLLAEDLRRFLADRTILARRSSPQERLWRWCRRNPSVATLLSAVAGLLIFIAAYYSVAAARYKRESLRASRAEADSREKLFASSLGQARASRSSRRPGQRFAALNALREAAKIHRDPALRDEAIACLALPDLELVREWPGADWSSCLDPTFSRFAIGERDGTIRICSVDDGALIQHIEFQGENSPGFILEFSHDGQHLAASHFLGRADDQLIRVFKVGREQPVLVDSGPVVGKGAGFTPDGRQFAVGHRDGTVTLYSLSTGEVVRSWTEGIAPSCLRFSPDGRKIAFSFRGTPALLRVRDVASGKQVAEFPTPPTYEIAWHPDGRMLAVACDDRKIYLHWVVIPEPASVLEHRNVGLSADFSPAGGLLATNGWERRTRLWRPTTGELALSFPARDTLGFRRDGRQFAAATWNNSFAIYNVADGREFRTLGVAPGRATVGIGRLALHPRQQLLVVPVNEAVAFWNIEQDAEIGSLPIGSTTLDITASGDLLTTGALGSYRWKIAADPHTPNLIRVGPPARLALPGGLDIHESQNGRFVGVAHLNGATLLDRDNPGHPIHLTPQDDVRFLAISPDGRWAATGSHQTDDGVKVWSLPEGRLVHQVQNTSDSANAIFSDDGRWIVINTAGRYRVQTTGDWKGGFERLGTGLTFSPDSRLLTVADSSGSIRLIEVAGDRLVATLEDPNANRAMSAVITRDSSRLIFDSVDSLATHVWDLRAIRSQLATINLDWEWPQFDTSEPEPRREQPLRLKIDYGEFFARHPASAISASLDRLSSALKSDPENAELFTERGVLWKRSGKSDAAIADFTRALEVRPKHARALAARGELEIAERRYEAGLADVKASLAEEPDQPLASNNLAWFLVTGPSAHRDPALALPLAERAVRLAPSVASYHNTLGVVLVRLARHREAIKELETSLAAAPKSQKAYDFYFLAICHLRLGDRARARTTFERARELHLGTRLPADAKTELDGFRAEVEALLAASEPPR